jgi:CRISPR-associated exonuclease Cas4
VPEDDDLVPLSALQHYLYCPRQCALIHIERLWAESVATVEGRLLHEKTEKPGAVARSGRRVVYGMPLTSRRLGVSGIADVVELERAGSGWRARPVEYKRGRPKAHRADEVQLCAQAMALEEMLGTEVADGDLFYGQARRRVTVALDPGLRALTERVAAETAAMIAAGRTPEPVYEARRCDGCSLLELCRPKPLGMRRSAAVWLAARIGEEGS